MNYPLISEYIESIKNAEENFEQLKHLRPVMGDDGLPVMSGGNFAVVFKMKDERTGKLHAVKCFLKEQEGRAEAYRLIAEELEYVSSTFLTPIKYLDKELFVDTGQTTEKEFPVLLMDWVEGQTLDKYIREHIDDQYELSLLAYQFSRLAMWLMPQPFAHGDLKPDNILVKEDGTLVLVDYDGMYVPAMKGQKARELGSPDFRHPGRTEEVFDDHIDDFSLASILLSLKAIALQPSLLEEYGASDRLLFSEKDYRNLPESSALGALQPLMQDAELASLYSLYILALSQNNLSQVSFRLFNLARPDKSQYEEENLSTEVTEEDLANAWTDEYGVKYSKDKKRLLKAPRDLKEYSILESTQIICDEAFYRSNIEDVVIPKQTLKIGLGAFSAMSYLSSLSVETGNMIYDSRGNCNAVVETKSNKLVVGCSSTIIPQSVEKIGTAAYMGCSGLLSITIPSNIVEIGDYAFYSCEEVKSVFISNSVREIGFGAFAGMNHLRSIEVDRNNTFFDSRDNCCAIIDSRNSILIVGCSSTTIPNGVEVIGSGAFAECEGLKTIVLPNSIIKIDHGAFYKCTNLISAFIPRTVTKIGNNVFQKCTKLDCIIIPKGTMDTFSVSLNEYKSKLIEKDFKTIVTPKDIATGVIDEFGVMYSADGERLLKAFSVSELYLSNKSILPPKDLDNYIIKEGTIYICDDAFNLSALKSVFIPQSVKTIGNAAFSSSDLTKMDIQEGLSTIGDFSFMSSSIESISIPNSVVEIGRYIFDNCKKLKYIYIPIGSRKKFEELLPEFKDKLVEQEMGWTVKETRQFNAEEIAAVKRAEVVASQYGNSVCFFMQAGGQTYIPLSKQSKLAVGDELDIRTAKVITLCRKGKEDIVRVLE